MLEDFDMELVQHQNFTNFFSEQRYKPQNANLMYKMQAFSRQTVSETVLIKTVLIETALIETALIECVLIETALIETVLIETGLIETVLIETVLIETVPLLPAGHHAAGSLGSHRTLPRVCVSQERPQRPVVNVTSF